MVLLNFTLTKSLVQEDYKTYIETIIESGFEELNEILNTKSGNFDIDWAQSLFELSNNFEELSDFLAERPTFYKEIFSYCAANQNYRIFFEYNNGVVEEVSNISNKLS